ncbi:MAG: hypothetical protein ACRERV_03540, partial [Methylococcales bacterium]
YATIDLLADGASSFDKLRTSSGQAQDKLRTSSGQAQDKLRTSLSALRIVEFFRWEMSDYRRDRVSGGTFFTVNLLERRPRLLVDHIGIAR